MSSRKELMNEYKERKRCGGVYIIKNAVNGKYLLGHVADLKSVHNHFQFAMMTGSAMHPKLRKEWGEMGAEAFTLEVLAELEQKVGQGQVEFMDELKALEELWRAELDASKEY